MPPRVQARDYTVHPSHRWSYPAHLIRCWRGATHLGFLRNGIAMAVLAHGLIGVTLIRKALRQDCFRYHCSRATPPTTKTAAAQRRKPTSSFSTYLDSSVSTT